MHKRQFLSAAAAVGMLPMATATHAKSPRTGPALLTVGGAVTKSNRLPIDMQLDQMMVKHGIRFTRAFAFDSDTLHRLPKVSIHPTLEYDGKPHTLTGPLLTTVLTEAGVSLQSPLRLGLRAVDGYNVDIELKDAQAYRMIVATHLDGHPMGLGGLGPQWAVYDPEAVPEFKDKTLKERFALCPWGVYYIEVTRL